MTESNYYRLNIPQFGEYYEWGTTAQEAIATTREAFARTARDLGRHATPLGAITARPAVYGEWKHSAKSYTNGGDFLGRDING